MLVIGITIKDDLTEFIHQETLVETNPSLAGISQISEVNALYFGVGLCNKDPMFSAGLPVDVLSMILSGEKLSVPKHILVADTHATTNGLDTESVDRLAGQYQETLQRAVENLGFSGWRVTRASEIDQTPAYKELIGTIEASHDYIRRELADMRWFNQEHEVDLKVGWALKGSKNSDETSFDQRYQRRFDGHLGFIYVMPGRTFNPKRLRSAPYFCTNSEERILLQADENVTTINNKIALAKEKFSEDATKAYEKYLNNLVRLYNTMVENTEKGPIANRLHQIIDRSTK